MVLLEFELFSGLDWKYIKGNIVADNIEIALSILNKNYPLEFRYKPFNDSKVDSLKYNIEEAKYFILDKE